MIEGPRVEREDEVQQAEEALRQAEQAEQALQGQPQALPQTLQEARQKVQEAERQVREARQVRGEISSLNSDGLMKAIVSAINSLEENGYVAPYVCVFGRNPFEAAYNSIPNSTVLPRDRIEPLIGRELPHVAVERHHRRKRRDRQQDTEHAVQPTLEG